MQYYVINNNNNNKMIKNRITKKGKNNKNGSKLPNSPLFMTNKNLQ